MHVERSRGLLKTYPDQPGLVSGTSGFTARHCAQLLKEAFLKKCVRFFALFFVLFFKSSESNQYRESRHFCSTPQQSTQAVEGIGVFCCCESNVHTDKILGLFILLAKYHAKTNNGSPLTQVFLKIVKERLTVEKRNGTINYNTVNFRKEWTLQIIYRE